jgi:Ca2+-binding EF-hand superfamily protein
MSNNDQLDHTVESIMKMETGGNHNFMSSDKLQDLEKLLQKVGKSEIFILLEQLPFVLKSIGIVYDCESLDPFTIKCCKVPGRISSDEIIQLIKLMSDENEKFNIIQAACNQLDKDQSGRISCKNLLTLIRTTRKKFGMDDSELNKKTIEKLLQEGEIDYANKISELRKIIGEV